MLVFYALKALDFSRFIKQNHVYEAQILYLIIAFVLTIILTFGIHKLIYNPF